MTKQKISAVLLAGLILMSLAGCAEHTEPIKTAPDTTVAADVTSGTKSNDEITAEPVAPTESISDEETAPETELPTEKEENQPEPPSPPEVQPEAPESAETKPVQTKPPRENKPVPTEPVQPPKTEKPKPPEPPATEDPKPESPKPTEPPATETPKPEPPKPTEPSMPEYSQADYDRIIREVTKYAESYTKKGFTFEWKDSMEFGWDVGYMGTPRIETEGVNGTISRLKTHIDKIVETGTNPAYGIPSNSVTYKVVQITIDGEIAFAVIYGG